MTLYVIALCCLIAGFVIRKTLNCADKISGLINKLVIFIIMPIIIISTIPDLSVSIQSGFVVLMPWLAFFAPLPLSFYIARKYGFQKKELVAVIILGGLGNTAFLGIGLVQRVFGDEAVPSAVLYDQLGSFLIVATVVSICVAIYADREATVQRPSVKGILIKVLSFPPFISTIVAFFIPSTDIYGNGLNHFFDLLSLTIIPLASLIIGLQIQLRIEQKHRIPLTYILVMKLVFLPLFILAASLVVGIQKPEFSAVIFQSAMPPMVTPAIMMIEAKIAPKLVASALGLGCLASFISLPIWAKLLSGIAI